MLIDLFIHGCIVVAYSGFAPPDEGVMQPPDVEQLLQAFENSDKRIRWQAVKDLAQYNVVDTETIMRIVEIARRHRNQEQIENNAIMALERLGAKATSAIPYLTTVLLDEEYPPTSSSSFLAGMALVAMGPDAAPAIPSLIKAVHSERLDTRRAAIQALGAIGTDAHEAVPVLFDTALHDKSGGLIWCMEDKAKRALAKIGTPAVPLMLEALTNESDRHREIAAFVLKHMTLETRNGALPAKEALKKSLQDRNAIVRVDAALAYWNLSKEVEEVRPLLVSVIRGYLQARDGDLAAGKPLGMAPREVEAAVVGIRYLGEDAAPALGLLIDVLSHNTPGGLDLHVIETLGELGNTARPAIPRLEKMSTVRDVRLRRTANDALQRITSGRAGTIERDRSSY